MTDYQRAKEESREALRLGILDAAGRLLVEEGPQALSMRRVAREVNASTQVLCFRPSEETLAKTWGTFDALTEAVRACAQAGLFAGEVEEEPREAALSLWSAAHGVVSLHIAGHLPDEAEARRVFERTMRGVVEGLLVRKQDAE